MFVEGISVVVIVNLSKGLIKSILSGLYELS